jgi:hypothetical protein
MISIRASRLVTVLAAAFLLALVSMFAAGCDSGNSASISIGELEKTNSEINPSSLPVSYRSTTTVIDRKDASMCVAIADYVFVGIVDSYEGVTYRDVQTIETADGIKTIGDPYSKFSITVMENIKGDLILNTSIPMLKPGGVNLDGASVEIDEGDSLPVTGKVYVFLVMAQPDGETLLIAGANSNILIEEAVSDELVALSDADESSSDGLEATLEESCAFNKYSAEAEKDERGAIRLPDIVIKAEEAAEEVDNIYDSTSN